MIITISGVPGSGKSTVAKILAQKLGYEYFSVGETRGKLALEKNLTLDELNKLGEKEDWTDRPLDEQQKQLGQTRDNLVIEGRLSWYFIPRSFKVFLTVEIKEAARRTLENRAERPDEKTLDTLDQAQKAAEERLTSDKKRYLKYYGLDYTDPKHYDLVIDTTGIPAEEVARQILDQIKKRR